MISYFVRQKLDINSVIIAKAHSDRIKSINEALGNIRELILGDRQMKHYHSFIRTEVGLKNASVQNGFISVAPKFLVEGIGIIVLLFTAFSDEFWIACNRGTTYDCCIRFCNSKTASRFARSFSSLE